MSGHFGLGDKTVKNNKFIINDVLSRGLDSGSYLLRQYIESLYPECEMFKVSGELKIFSYLNKHKIPYSSHGEITRYRNIWAEEKNFDIKHETLQGWYVSSWEGVDFHIIIISSGMEHLTFLVAPYDTITSIVQTVTKWGNRPSDTILSFMNGIWSGSTDLFKEVQKTNFEDIVLKDSIRNSLINDINKFFGRRELYESLNLPWKRGIIIYGPPGNGKSMLIKSMIAEFNAPCLYVQSFQSSDVPESYTIKNIFRKVRSSAPCVLVLEDLDSMISHYNRSSFLNEMDGFAENTGVLVLATTNYLEKLDPSITERPGRFDRKYLMSLPDENLRKEFINRWISNAKGRGVNISLQERSISKLCKELEGYSFASIKEILGYSTLIWMESGGSLRDIIWEQIKEMNGSSNDGSSNNVSNASNDRTNWEQIKLKRLLNDKIH